MRFYEKILISGLFLFSTCLQAADFTISTYNCGGLSNHFDYLRAVSMQKLMQERYSAEPENMALNEKLQQIALKLLFAPDPLKANLQKEWDKNYKQLAKKITASPNDKDSLNASWNKKVDELMTSYKIRPITIHDPEMIQMLEEHLGDLAKEVEGNLSDRLEKVRAKMAERIFNHYMKFDIICLQEADYLKAEMFPKHYQVAFSNSHHSINGVAWNSQRFDLIEDIGDIRGRGYAVHLRDKETQKTLLVASGHISGCNPYAIERDRSGMSDAAKGDSELQAIIDLFDTYEADMRLIGMDSNVTSLHPRLRILKDHDYQIDYENALECTCTNPYQVLNTRIDWVALKPNDKATITNIPVLSVNLNSMQTNISDHKPVAAKISY